MIRRFVIFLVIAGVFGGAGFAQERSSLLPDVPKATGKPHPQGNAFMRINHMKLMRHDRDDTMHNGNREIEYSLKECVTCHAVLGPDALPISVKEEGHFCRACHDYAAVKIDCFQCHNSKPDLDETQALLARPLPDATGVTAYLDEVSQ